MRITVVRKGGGNGVGDGAFCGKNGGRVKLPRGEEVRHEEDNQAGPHGGEGRRLARGTGR